MAPSIKVIYFPHGVLSLKSTFFPCTKTIIKGIYNIAVMSPDEDEVRQNLNSLIYLLEERADYCSYYNYMKDLKKITEHNFQYLEKLCEKDGRILYEE